MMVVKLAWRSLWRYRRRTLITVSAIVVGTALALFFVTMADGMYKKLVDEAVRMEAGYVTVEHRSYSEDLSIDLTVDGVSGLAEEAREIPGVTGVKVLILGQAVVSTGSGSAGVGLFGVDPDTERGVSPLAQKIVEGRYLEPDDTRGIVLGARLAERLKLEPGKKLVVTTNDVHGELVNEMLRVTGIFRMGMEEADGFLVQVPLDVARRIFHIAPDAATRVGLVLTSPKDLDRVLTELRGRLAGRELAVLPWQEVMPDLAGFMTVDKGFNYVFQIIILFIIGFTILNTILMSVLERKREFATLMAIGTSTLRLRLQVAVESLFLGILGTGGGLLIGGVLSWYFQVRGIDFSGIYSDDTTIVGYAIDPLIKNYVTVDAFALVGFFVLGLTLIIGLYPSWRSAKISLPDVLRSR
jgi:ABC-type lipoprotein release transport system permease subunit